MKQITHTNISIARGEIFQIAKDMRHVLPAKSAHGENFRRFCSIIRVENDKLSKIQDAEYKTACDLIPIDQRSDAAFKVEAKRLADIRVTIRVAIKDLQVYVAACMAANKAPSNELGNGQPFGNLMLIHQDLVALGVWDKWGLSAKLEVPDESLDKEFDPGVFPDDEVLDEDLPAEALGEDTKDMDQGA